MDMQLDPEVLARMASHAHAIGCTATALLDLDDSLLRYICHMLQPLPDVFSMAQTCWRMRRVTHDKQRWLVVAPAGYDLQRLAPAAPSGRTYPTLAAAVSASRPGDTLWLAPHTLHAAAGVTIPWPLQLLGGGARPEDTWLTADKGSDCVLDFNATAKLARVAVAATLAPCLVHRSGTLTVDQCLLTSDAQGLAHLVSPLLTYATHMAAAPPPAAAAAARALASAGAGAAAGAAAATAAAVDPAAVAAGSAAAGGVNTGVTQQVVWGAPPPVSVTPGSSHHQLPSLHLQQQQQQQQQQRGDMPAATPPLHSSNALCSSSSSKCPPRASTSLNSTSAAAGAAGAGAAKPCRLAAGPGRLSVTETQLKGGAAGVRCEGSGRLRGVRVIYESHASFFWLEVDSADPGALGCSGGSHAAAAAGSGVKRLLSAAAAACAAAAGKRLALSCGQEAAGVELAGDKLQQLAVQQRQQQGGVGAAAAAAGGAGASCEGQELTGLARIQSLLGSRAQLLQEHLAAAPV